MSNSLKRQKEMWEKYYEESKDNPEMVEIIRGQSTLFRRIWKGGYHRLGRTFCPHCSYYAEFRGTHSRIEFMLPPHLHQVIIDNELGKRDTCIVISSCPKCREYSWEHIDLLSLKTYVLHGAKIDLKKVREMFVEIKKENWKEWDDSLCKTCQNLTKAPGIMCDIPGIICHKGPYISASRPQKECDEYTAGEENKLRFSEHKDRIATPEEIEEMMGKSEYDMWDE